MCLQSQQYSYLENFKCSSRAALGCFGAVCGPQAGRCPLCPDLLKNNKIKLVLARVLVLEVHMSVFNSDVIIHSFLTPRKGMTSS